MDRDLWGGWTYVCDEVQVIRDLVIVVSTVDGGDEGHGPA